MFKASFPESDFPDSSLDVPDIWRSRSVATNLNSTAQSPIMRTLSVPVLPRDNALTALPAAQKGFESRVHHLRTSIQNYQHWKLWRQTVSQSAASARKDSPMSPLESILGLVRRRMKPNQMLKIAHTHYLRLRYRIAGLHTLSELVRSICFGSSRIALLGRLQSSLRESSCNSAASLEAGVCCCPSVWRESLLASFGSLFSTLIVFISDGSAPLAVRMLAFRDVYGIDFDAHHCRLIETWRMLDNVTNVVMHPKVNLSITSKGSTKVQEDFLDAVWAALRLVAFRVLRFSADDLQGTLPVVIGGYSVLICYRRRYSALCCSSGCQAVSAYCFSVTSKYSASFPRDIFGRRVPAYCIKPLYSTCCFPFNARLPAAQYFAAEPA